MYVAQRFNDVRRTHCSIDLRCLSSKPRFAIRLMLCATYSFDFRNVRTCEGGHPSSFRQPFLGLELAHWKVATTGLDRPLDTICACRLEHYAVPILTLTQVIIIVAPPPNVRTVIDRGCTRLTVCPRLHTRLFWISRDIRNRSSTSSSSSCVSLLSIPHATSRVTTTLGPVLAALEETARGASFQRYGSPNLL